MGKFLIEDNYYIVALDNCYALAKVLNKTSKDGKEYADMDCICYYSDPEKCLEKYLSYRQHLASYKAADGTLKDLINILSSENNRMRRRRSEAFTEVMEWRKK